MNKQKQNRTSWIHIRVSKEEHEIVKKAVKGTTCQSISQYARKKIMDKPITIITRNKSTDELVEQVIAVRTELAMIGKNYNQVVKKMHSLKEIQEVRVWLTVHENSKETVMNKVEETKNMITAIFSKWSQ